MNKKVKGKIPSVPHIDVVQQEMSSNPIESSHENKGSNQLGIYAKERLKESLEIVMAIACHDFEKKAEITDNIDDFDGLNMGLNMLGEELKSSTVSRDYLDDVFDSMSEMLLVLDINGSITSYNNITRNNLGYTHDELRQKMITDIVIPPKTSKDNYFSYEILTFVQKNNKAHYFETEFVGKNGVAIPVEVSLSAMSSGDTIVCLAKDITERLKAKHEQEKLLLNLEETNKELREFAYILSHDLKAPLRGISMLAQWIHDENINTLNADTTKNLDLLMIRIRRLFGFIEGVFEYSKIGQVKENKTKIDLNLLLPEIIDSLALPDSVTLNIDKSLPTLQVVKTHMIQLFQNLISNATKHAQRPDVVIDIDCLEQKDYWQFCVQDNGPGIPAKHYERIFKIFQTLMTKDKFDSTGIGLTIVKKIIDIYNGKIWIDSEKGEGSSFYFTFEKK